MMLTKKIQKFNFDIQKFCFKEIFLNHFNSININSLDTLHLDLPSSLLPKNIVTAQNDQAQNIYEFLYKIDEGYNLKTKKKSGDFLKAYNYFIKFIKDEIIKEDIIFQKKPTLRVHFPENKSVGEFHRDSEYNHPHEEINVWVPITDTKNSNSIWIESDYGKNDFMPQNINYGSFIIFDSCLKHGNKINKEKNSRLSFDFRIIPKSKWKGNSQKCSNDQKIKFKINDYYSITT